MEVICLSQADVESLDMSMREVLDALDRGFAAKGRGHTEMPPKPGIPAPIGADLDELAAGLKPGREGESERIFSMNMGIAVDDMVAAKVLYERALERGAGVRLLL